MKRLGVREFRDHATKYLAGDETLAIERHGVTIGYYIPTTRHATQAQREAAWDRLGQTIEEVLAQTGMTQGELADLFDLSIPLPEVLPGRKQALRALGR